MGLFTASEDKTRAKKLKEEGCVVTLQIDVPATKVQEATQNALVRFQSQVKLPGFRPGKAPIEVVRQQLSDAAREKVIDQLIREALPGALKEHGLQPVAPPVIHSIQMKPGQPLSFQAAIESSPQFQLKTYKKLPVTLKKYPATDEDVAKRLEELREGNARLEGALQDSLQKEHYAVIDYEGSADGKALKNAKGTDELLDMSAPGTVEGLSEGLIGAKRAETREIPVKAGGKPALFRVTVKDIKTKILPAADDELAKDLGHGSLLELRGKLREILEQEGKRKSERELTAQLEEGLLKANPFPVPPSLAAEALERLMERLREQLFGPRRPWPEQDKEKIREKLKPRAEDEVRLSYLLRAVAQAEKIDVTPQDLEAEKAEILKTAESESDREKFAHYFEEHKDGIQAAILDRKVMDFIRNSAAVAEA